MDLIQDLKNEHRGILAFFENIDATNDIIKKKELFLGLATLATAHLKKEDEQLYPVLQKSESEEIKKLGNIFADTMAGYSKDFVSVIERAMASADLLDETLLADWIKIRDKIKDRVVVEETLLFPAYERSV